ncbi:MAG: DUF357 domain-containing protein [Candidatus Hadarchaeales archaeon]
MGVESDLRAEIEKWSVRLDDALYGVGAVDETGARMIENARAYRSDSDHFLRKGDLVRSFECLVWAWAILETGKELGHVK